MLAARIGHYKLYIHKRHHRQKVSSQVKLQPAADYKLSTLEPETYRISTHYCLPHFLVAPFSRFFEKNSKIGALLLKTGTRPPGPAIPSLVHLFQ